MMRWAKELFGSLFSTSSAMAMASAGLRLNVILALAICGEERGAAHHFFEKPGAGAGGFFGLGAAQRFAGIIKSRLVGQHLAEERHRVIVVVALSGFDGLVVTHPQFPRNFIEVLFSHNKSRVGHHAAGFNKLRAGDRGE